MAKRLGIAITTFNRAAMLAEHLDAFTEKTTMPYDLVVCDDGSSDETVAMLKQRGVTVIGQVNRGIAWNKNRGILYLLAETDCDVILLLDDDVRPTTFGWDAEWHEATRRYGHVNNLYYPNTLLSGRCVATDIGISNVVSGQCLSFTRRLLSCVGFFDTRFGKYGHEHTDMSLRCLRAGAGGIYLQNSPWWKYYFYVMNGGLEVVSSVSHKDEESLKRNGDLLWTLESEPVYRPAWQTEADHAALFAELDAASSTSRFVDPRVPSDFDEVLYVEANPDLKASNSVPLQHYLSLGYGENRRLR